MQVDPSFQDLDGLEHLPPKTQTRVYEIRSGLNRLIADRAPELRVARERALRAANKLNALLRIAQTAAHDFAAFESSLGGKTTPNVSPLLILPVLLMAGIVEAFLAFPGVRFALGDLGQIRWPWDDPLALISALMIGVISMLAAQFAGWNLAWSERSTMHEPEPARIRIPRHLRALVKEETSNMRALLGASPLADLNPDGPETIPPSPEVIGRAERDRAEAEQEEQERAAHLLQAPRSRRVHLATAFTVIALQLVLWSITSILRAVYLARLSNAGTPTGGGLLQGLAVSKPAGLSPVATGLLIGTVSWCFFLLAVGIVFSLHPAADLRHQQLRRRMKQTDEALSQAIESVVEDIRAFEQERCGLETAQSSARNDESAARLAGAEIDLNDLDLD